MIILHGGFVDDSLIVWAEQAPCGDDSNIRVGGAVRKGTRKTQSTAILRSPYDCSAPQLVRAVLAAGVTLSARASPGSSTVWLPTSLNGPTVSGPLIGERHPDKSSIQIAAWNVTSISLDAETAVLLLCHSMGRDSFAPGIAPGASLLFWVTALRFAAALVTRGQYLPDIGYEEPSASSFARWQPCYLGADLERLHNLARSMPDVCRALSRIGAVNAPDTPRISLLSGFVTWTCDHLARTAAEPAVLTPAVRPSARSKPSAFNSLHDQWLNALRSETGRLKGDQQELASFAAQVREWKRPLAQSLAAPFRLCFRLDEPNADCGDGDADLSEASSSIWKLQYLLQARSDPSLLVPAEKAWQPKSREAKLLQRADFHPREYLLLSLGQAAKVSDAIELSLKAAAPGKCTLDSAGAHLFLSETAWMLEEAGFGVLLPAWWTRKGARLKITARASVKSPKLKANAGLGLETLVDFDWQLALGEHTLTLDELESLAKQKSSLVKLRGQWVQLDAGEIAAAIRFWKERKQEKTSLAQVVRMALGAGRRPDGLIAVEGVHATGWVNDFLLQLREQGSDLKTPLPADFAGTLRPYQMRGYSWLNFLRQWGFGACLADDMGLGKTCTTLAMAQEQWDTGDKRPTLIVCPTSVVGNWQKEAHKFAPNLPVMVHHGQARSRGDAFVQGANESALVLSSYALLNRDLDLLNKVHWAGVVLDEAQNIKNPDTMQARAARALKSDYRVALTGTPVENHVGDLWSLFEFINPGLLGTQADFKRRFFIPIQAHNDQEAASNLKRVTGPFLLRRLKTDKSIISDLPEKIEMKVYCTLTAEQASLYQAVVKELEQAIESAEGIQRSGIVLSTLSKIKQICNHPAQFLKDNSPLPGRSSKLARLTEMLEEALAAGDRALLFSQFFEMGDILRRHLQDTFGQEVLFLHGGSTKKQRDVMVERFQAAGKGPRLFILSLKAGGTGLNLTAANHVFHFDRWWNPAVENQATDRAFRIGQAKNVQVHKFLCVGTLEERIDEMIEGKNTVANSVVGTGEEWLTKLSNTQLSEMFALRAGAVEA